LTDQNERQPDRNMESGGGLEFEGQKNPVLLPRHREAHDEATQYLRMLYFEIEKNPTMALYNYNKFNRPSAAAKEAMDKIDEINGRLLNFNCSSRLSIAVGQIMRDRFVELWRWYIYAPEERKEKHVNALAKLCREHGYPSSWANIPPDSLVPSSRAEIDDHEDQ
jgi:hypothetical protein